MGGIETAGMGEGGSSYYLGSNYSTNAPANQQYYFEFDRSDVHSEYEPSIRAQGQYLASHPGARVRLEGNTDARGSREYNIALGERRALAVREILEANGAQRSQSKAVSFGEERPVAMGENEEAYQMNRRVDLNYEAK